MNVQETLPTELRMSAPPSLPQARSYLFKQRSEYTQYDMGKGTKIRINIPRLQRTYLSKDSYIRFRLNMDVTSTDTLNPAAPVYLDRCGAFSLFDRMEVYDYMGGTLIEQVNNIPSLMCMYRDLNNSLTDFNSKLQSLQGCDGSFVGISSPTTTVSAPAENLELRTSNSGVELFSYNWNGGADSLTKFQTFEFALPLPSFLGIFSEKFVPLHNGFSVDLFLNSVAQAFISYGADAANGPGGGFPPVNSNLATTITSAWISNAELCAQVMELGNDAENLVLASNAGGPLVVPSIFYRYFTDLVRGAGEVDQTSSIGVDLNLNVVSLRNIRFGMRPALYQNSSLYPSYGHRIRNFMENFSFRYGSSFLPELAGIACRSSSVPGSRIGSAYVTDSSAAAKMEGFKQAYAELLKTGKQNHLSYETSSCSINQAEYQTDLKYFDSTKTGAAALVYITSPAIFKTNAPPLGKFYTNLCGKFMGGIDLRLSAKNVISGIDTNGLLVRLNAKFDDENLGGMINAVLDIFAEYDAFVQIIPGVATTVTF